ncbi:TadE family type IV pilus minor pilin [Streptomyces sp. NPDC088141]|uniref:TadE family type IV pilus minor pilin n=1 Tax=Streptomyces sp. NPDC088141 TaxID=3155179 RepID=UPI00342A9781
MRSSRKGSGACDGGCGSAAGESGDRGAVTAEAAVAVPVLAVFALALVWALMAASAQIRCVDAARAGARAAARSEPEAQALEVTRSAAPDGAEVAMERAGELWRVRVSAPMPGLGPLALTLHADAAALAEDTVGATTQ